MKQTSSFQRWKKRYFKLRGRTLYYAKDAKVGLLSVSTHGAHAPVATGDELLIAFTVTVILTPQMTEKHSPALRMQCAYLFS